MFSVVDLVVRGRSATCESEVDVGLSAQRETTTLHQQAKYWLAFFVVNLTQPGVTKDEGVNEEMSILGCLVGSLQEIEFS